MAEITSSTYPVVNDSKSGDLYPIVRNGGLKKQPRSVLQAFVDGRVTEGTTQGGITADRPDAPETFEQYFDSTLGKPIWWDGSNWVDATGATV